MADLFTKLPKCFNSILFEKLLYSLEVGNFWKWDVIESLNNKMLKAPEYSEYLKKKQKLFTNILIYNFQDYKNFKRTSD